MASSKEFVDFVCEQISELGDIRYRKMFGEYMVYYKDKPVLMVCDDTVYIKQLECVKEHMKDALATIGKEELKDIIEKEGKAELVCHFCNKKYEFSKEELKQIIKE